MIMQRKAHLLQMSNETRIDLRKQNYGDEQVEFLTRQSTEHIKALWLQDTITFRSAASISQGRWDNIAYINLGWSLARGNIGDTGCKYLSKSHFPKLKDMIIGNNNISQVGAAHLSKVNWSSLRYLCLSNNSLKGKGVKQVVKMNCPSLKYLYLSRNGLMMSDILPLLKESSNSLRFVCLRNNLLAEDIYKIVLYCSGRFIKQFSLQIKGIDYDTETNPY